MLQGLVCAKYCLMVSVERKGKQCSCNAYILSNSEHDCHDLPNKLVPGLPRMLEDKGRASGVNILSPKSCRLRHSTMATQLDAAPRLQVLPYKVASL